ncbi:MAG TPA: phosphate acyltransferase [Bacteroidales bacterium]|nr:phosphate acyltransferase [Bacteroidales bacterium]HOR82762.1 phosphate acyltransferase [Bacteroidales bacterium]HPJ91978.1 phosphate acyltransferase [Bacteroidales bacterium]HQB20618.1 phosphate acyltransferase [Bacteroidales bacterium]
MSISKLDQMVEVVKSNPKKRLVAAYANDAHTIEAIYHAIENNIVDATLVGDEATINNVCKELGFDVSKFKIVQEADENKAGPKAVALINEGEGNILMKGLLSTDKYMRAILNKENGLMPGAKAVLSHATIIETPAYHKLIICGDVAVIPAPDLNQKVAITNYLIKIAHKLEISQPKVALVAATEQMLVGMPACIDAAIISKMADRGQIKGALIDGPLALDVTLDKESAQIKKLASQVAGDADCLVFPNIEAGNVFYKTCTKLAGGELAAMVCGAKVPCILTSRGDSAKSKNYSIALAALMAN